MRMYDIIAKKRDGKELSSEEIEFFIRGYTAGEIPDYQASALLMAAYLRGLSFAETDALTSAVLHSGSILDLSDVPGIKADKHSTGGVGDGVSLAVAPLAAACGVKVAMMSGRGLGHTGGTLDKLESIEGYNCYLSPERFRSVVESVGCSIIGQTKDLAPADKKLYALRDVTATVNKKELITASILGKKLAEGIDCLVLDVKTGSGAFMKTTEEARALAALMVRIAKEHGVKVSALITDMDCPLGNAVGNSLEVIEAIECLKGRAPEDYTSLAIELAARMLYLAEKGTMEECRIQCEKALENGAAWKKFKDMVAAHGGNTAWIEDTSLFPSAECSRIVRADRDGFISHIDTELYGTASLLLGAGRIKKEDPIDPSAGIKILKKTGDRVEKGDGIAVLFASDEGLFVEAEKTLKEALAYSEFPPEKRPLIIDILE